MRIISGKFKGKRISAPSGERVRPTQDRVKETSFNILYSKNAVAGARVLDLFAGTGNLGIEALSNGAEACVFVDIDKESLKFIKQNLANVGIDPRESYTVSVYHNDYKSAIKKCDGRFDLIFVDPPYNFKNFDELVDLIAEYGILSAGGVVMIEHDSKVIINADKNLFNVDIRKLGNTTLTFLERI